MKMDLYTNLLTQFLFPLFTKNIKNGDETLLKIGKIRSPLPKQRKWHHLPGLLEKA